MTKEELRILKIDVLNLLTDKNVKYVKAENEDEEFGALVAYGVAFRKVNALFETKYRA